MPPPVQIPLELAYHRRVLFAVELLDAVTLQRVHQGIQVVAQGLRGRPVVNAGGLFVWLEEDLGRLHTLAVVPGVQPYERVELDAAQVKRPLTTIELPPRVDYPFASGVTGMRGTLIERQVVPPQHPEPVPDATIRFRWLDEDGNWHDSVTASRTDPLSGDFVAILRLASTEKPAVDASGAVTVRLRASRAGGNERSSTDLKLRSGRMTNPSPLNPGTFAWDEFMP